jgi:hypothetical protein
LGAARAGDKAQGYFRHANPRIRVRHAVMGRQRDFSPPAQCLRMKGCNNRFCAGFDAITQLRQRRFMVWSIKFADIRARRKHRPRSQNHRRLYVVVCVNACQNLPKAGAQRA